VLERDYGCGDPSRHLAAGEVVLDLGSGGGKICFIASQVVGPTGRVIGVDVNDEMLALARRAAPAVAAAVGHANVEFRKGQIQDLALDLDRLSAWLSAHPVTDLASFAAMEAEVDRQRRSEPLVADASVDAVVSNCVLNLVATEHKSALFSEIFRVLRHHGRAVISDIVSDQVVPDHLRTQPELWSGCISGAFQEDDFLSASSPTPAFPASRSWPGARPRGGWWRASSSGLSPSSPRRTTSGPFNPRVAPAAEPARGRVRRRSCRRWAGSRRPAGG